MIFSLDGIIFKAAVLLVIIYSKVCH